MGEAEHVSGTVSAGAMEAVVKLCGAESWSRMTETMGTGEAEDLEAESGREGSYLYFAGLAVLLGTSGRASGREKRMEWQ